MLIIADKFDFQWRAKKSDEMHLLDSKNLNLLLSIRPAMIDGLLFGKDRSVGTLRTIAMLCLIDLSQHKKLDVVVE